MKSLLAAVVFFFLFATGYAQAKPTKTPTIDETENGFVSAGKNYCKNNKSLFGVVVDSKDSFIAKKGEAGKFVQTKTSEIVILILCNDDHIFYLTGPDINSLTLTIVTPMEKGTPKKPNKSMF